MREVVIVSAVRTPIGSFGGALKDRSAVDLGVVAVRGALERVGLKPEQVDEVVLGNVLQAGLGQNVARQVALRAGLPNGAPAFTVNQVCGSGLKSVVLAAQSIALGDAEIVVAGGTESMSQAPYVLRSARWGQRMGDGKMVDVMVHDGLWDAFNDVHMGITAENIAQQFGITREDQDQFAATSQQRVEAAQKANVFSEEIVSVEIPGRKGEVVVVDRDEFPRAGVTAESLGKLKPAFKKDGTVTAGNASGINDGAAALVLMSREKAQELGLQPLARVVSYATAGVDPAIMGTGPIPACKKALAKAGLGVGDVDLVEANEAFAAQALSVMRELQFDPAKTNIYGGAISLGHPIGASGARVLTTLIYGLRREGKKIGMSTLCIGGGMGIAMVIERL